MALFFSVDGSAVGARSPEECPIEQGEGEGSGQKALAFRGFIGLSFGVYRP